jgi:hypothetical protein
MANQSAVFKCNIAFERGQLNGQWTEGWTCGEAAVHLESEDSLLPATGQS